MPLSREIAAAMRSAEASSSCENGSSSSRTCGPPQQRPREREPLPLPARQADAPLARPRSDSRPAAPRSSRGSRRAGTPARCRRSSPAGCRAAGWRAACPRTAWSPAAPRRSARAARWRRTRACRARRCARRPRPGKANASSSLSSVLLPQPEGPVITTHSPGSTHGVEVPQQPRPLGARSGSRRRRTRCGPRRASARAGSERARLGRGRPSRRPSRRTAMAACWNCCHSAGEPQQRLRDAGGEHLERDEHADGEVRRGHHQPGADAQDGRRQQLLDGVRPASGRCSRSGACGTRRRGTSPSRSR